ncbi:MAG: hypothetical protein NZM26_00055 [Patescibacteria group bacterium]|nr:hypothetical protein [Patescibacteria group bacterium]
MEENHSEPESKPDQKNSNFLPMAVVFVIAAIAIGVYLSQQKPATHTTNTSPAIEITNEKSSDTVDTVVNTYKDGDYEALGQYTTPGGQSEIGLRIKLEKGIIIDSSVEIRANDPPSRRFQQEFAKNYKQFVIGKKIDDLNLTKVAGSSLTPKGFNEAIAKIKAEAKS